MQLLNVTIIEELDCYLVVTLDGEKVGLGDEEGFFYTPCDMDAIHDCRDDDYSVFVLERDGKYGFFLDDSKYIEPTYDDCTMDENGDIHVKREGVYGIFKAPDYEYKEVSEEETLLACQK